MIVNSLFRKERQNSSGFSELLASRSASGVNVTVEKALAVSAVFACLRTLANGIAQVPLKIYKSEGEGRTRIAHDHAWYDILSVKPNEWQTSFEFRENLMFQAGLSGNFYAFKSLIRGKPTSLIPFEPGAVEVSVNEKRQIEYKVTATNGEQRIIPASAMWHVRGSTWNTYIGMEAVKYAREAIGLSINIEDAQNKLHANGVQTSGFLSVDGSLDPAQYVQLRNWVEKNIGGENKFKPFIVDRGAKFQPVSMSGVDAQTIENRRFQIEEICRHFGVAPIMVYQNENATTYASSEHQYNSHKTNTLEPWYRKLEDSVNANILSKEDRANGFYAKFNVNGLLRGLPSDRVEYYWKMYQMKALNPNEIRALEEYDSYDGGDEFYIAQGMQDQSEPAEAET